MSPVYRVSPAQHDHGLPVRNFIPGFEKQQHMLVLDQQHRVPACLRHVRDADRFRPVAGYLQRFLHTTVMDMLPAAIRLFLFHRSITGPAYREINLRIRRAFPAAAEPDAQQGAVGQRRQTAAVAHGCGQCFAYQLFKQKRSHLSLFIAIPILPFHLKNRKKIQGFGIKPKPRFTNSGISQAVRLRLGWKWAALYDTGGHSV